MSVVLTSQLVSVDLHPADRFEAIDATAAPALKRGFIETQYIDAAVERERQYATALPLGDINVAIPHADSDGVITPCICVARLSEPVEWVTMGTESDLIPVRFVMLLALERTSQVQMLANLARALQDRELLETMLTAESDEVAFLLQHRLGINNV